jgi:carbonic anhydrase
MPLKMILRSLVGQRASTALLGFCICQGSCCLGADSAAIPKAHMRLLREATLTLLKEGNSRFVSGQMQHPNLDAEQRKLTVTEGQQPFATVLACSDSRDPVELIFDRGIGDLFVVRVAGNVAGISELATIEYGLGHLGTPLFVVMGHTKCGAVTAVATGAELHGHLVKLAEKIQPAADKAKAQKPSPEELVPRAIEANVWNVMEEVLKQSDVVRDLVIESQVHMVGALYDLESGTVKWLGPHPDLKRILVESSKNSPARETASTEHSSTSTASATATEATPSPAATEAHPTAPTEHAEPAPAAKPKAPAKAAAAAPEPAKKKAAAH